MNFSTREIFDGKCLLRLPEFSGESDNARRMNNFYETLGREILAFAKSKDFPSFAKYRCDFTCRSEEDRMIVRLRLALKIRGRVAGEKVLCHTWKNGVILKDKKGLLGEKGQKMRIFT